MDKSNIRTMCGSVPKDVGLALGRACSCLIVRVRVRATGTKYFSVAVGYAHWRRWTSVGAYQEIGSSCIRRKSSGVLADGAKQDAVTIHVQVWGGDAYKGRTVSFSGSGFAYAGNDGGLRRSN